MKTLIFALIGLLAVIVLANAIPAIPALLATLAKDTQIPLVVEGKTVGSMTLKAGSQVTITQILPSNAGVIITRGESATAKIPNEAITPESLQAAIAATTAQTAAQTAAMAAQENAKATALAAAQAAADVPIKTEVTKDNLALYQKIESMIKSGRKKTGAHNPDPSLSLLNYESPAAPKLDSLIGKTFTKEDAITEVNNTPNSVIPPRTKTKTFKIVKRENGEVDMGPTAITVEFDQGVRWPFSLTDLTKEAKQRLMPNARLIEGKDQWLVFKGLTQNYGRISVDTVDLGEQSLKDFTPEAVAKALSN